MGPSRARLLILKGTIMTIKALSYDEMKTKLGDMVEGRRWLAGLILNGHTSFSENGETYALRGSPALSRGEPDLVTRDVSPAPRARTSERDHETESDRLLCEYREEAVKEERSAPTETLARVAPPGPAPEPQPIGHARIADRLDGKSEALPLNQSRQTRIATQRAVDATRERYTFQAVAARSYEPASLVTARAATKARRIGHIQGHKPSSIAARLGDGPKGAA
jgi:hypothetical protein